MGKKEKEKSSIFSNHQSDVFEQPPPTLPIFEPKIQQENIVQQGNKKTCKTFKL